MSGRVGRRLLVAALAVAMAALGGWQVLRPAPAAASTNYVVGIARWAYANSFNENVVDGVARVGRSESGSLYRSYFAFDVAPLQGKHILAAAFVITLTHSWSCTSTPVNLYRVGPHGAGKQPWPGPALVAWTDERSGHANKSTSCGGPQPDMVMQFSNQLVGQVQAAADANLTEFSVGLSARRFDGSGESTISWWKKFSPGSARLQVVYE